MSPETGEYDYLEPLQRAYAVTAADDPERIRLREELVIGYLPVARNIARRYHGRGEPLDDLEQVAAVGLLKAIERFDPDHGHHFLSFAVPTITGEIRRHFRDRTWSMRMPRRLKELHGSVNQISGELSARLGRAPRPSEIAARLGVHTEEVLEALQASQAYRAQSLDAVLSHDDSSGDGPSLRGTLGVFDSRVEQFIDSHSLAPHLEALPRREREILLMRFYDNMTQSQIGARMGISQMHVSRLLSTTLARLRDAVDHDKNDH
jgi:RNA polymerase sigma-B factor